MKKLCLFFLIMTLMVSTAYGNEKVVLSTGEWEPYTSEKMDNYGFVTEIVTAAFNSVGIEVEYNFRPWARVKHEISEGSTFAGFPYSITEERKADFDFSDIVTHSTGKFFYKKSSGKIPANFKWEKFEDLKNFVIGGSLGYWYEKPFKEAGLNVDYASNSELNFKKLNINRVDLVPDDELVGWEIIRKKFPDNIDDFATLEKPMNQSDLHLMISRNYPNYEKLTEKFNKGLKKIKENGKYQKILEKYGLKN